MSTISNRQPTRSFGNKHSFVAEREIRQEVSKERQAWLHDMLGFFSTHQNYAACKDELEGFFLSTFNADGSKPAQALTSPHCRQLVREYRTNDFLLGISARLILQHGKEKGKQLAKAFQRIWQAGVNLTLI